MKLNIAYVISQVSHSKLFEWTAAMLSKEKYNLCFILMHKEETPFELFLREKGFKVHRIGYSSKRDIPRCILHIRKILKLENIQIVHTHLFEAGLAGSIAGKLAGIPRRIHTRHDATIHHDFHPGAVKYDRIINRSSTEIIAITENVKNILMNLENVPETKIHVIHHGFLLSEYANVDSARISAITKKYFPSGKTFPVIGIVSRFIEWKGIQYVIPAFRNILEQHPNAHLLLANAQGPYENQLNELLKTIPSENYSRILFEKDIAALYHVMDIFVHVPVDAKSEAFGQVYIEAMSAGVPSVFTLSGIATDCVQDRLNALVVPFCNSPEIQNKILELVVDVQLRDHIRTNASQMVQANYGIERMIHELELRYDA